MGGLEEDFGGGRILEIVGLKIQKYISGCLYVLGNV